MANHPSWERLEDFFALRDFAVLATVGASQVPVLFDDPYTLRDLLGIRVDARTRVVRGREADLGGVRKGDTITVGADTYRATTDAQSDGQGTAQVVLQIQPPAPPPVGP